MSEKYESALTYNSYLAVDELLKLQRPLSTGPEHDEMLFIIIHQTYELWFKQLIHEFKQAQSALEACGPDRYLRNDDSAAIQRLSLLSFFFKWVSICSI